MTRRNNTPKVASLVAVVALFILTIIPTYYPFFRYPNKNSSSDLSSSSRISSQLPLCPNGVSLPDENGLCTHKQDIMTTTTSTRDAAETKHAQLGNLESVETETTIDTKTETKPFQLSDTDSEDTTHTSRDEAGAGTVTGMVETAHINRDEAGTETATSAIGMGDETTQSRRDEARAGTATSATGMGETPQSRRDEAGAGSASSATGMVGTTQLGRDKSGRDEAGAGTATSATGMGETTQSGRDEAVATISPEKNVTKVEKANCDIFSGEWVPNPEAPYYTNNTCSEIQEHQNCLKFGRPDKQYLQWKWKPEGCELPVFDPYSFLQLVRGKSMAFVGDSVARNHMQSLICLLSRVEEMVDISDEKSPSHFKRYQYPNHNFTIEIFSSPYLVKTMQPDDGSPINLYLDEFDEKWTTKIEHFDYVIISAGHWFSRPQMFYEQGRIVGCLYCTESHINHLTSDFSYRRAFRTAFRAINSLENYKGITFLRTFAPSHFEGGQWDKGGDCVRKMPFKNGEARLEGYNLEYYKIQVEEIKIAEHLGRRRGLKFRLFDVTQAMLLRPDGHPSKYGYWPQENVTWANDCVHWCLPGPVDSWNDLLMEMLKREERA